MAKKKDDKDYGTTWTCQSCEGKPHFDEFAAFKAHLIEVHGCTEPIKGKKQMNMHFDGTDWFSSVYEWTINGAKFTEASCQPRKKPLPVEEE